MEAGIRELRDNLSRYLTAVRAGTEVTVTDHGKAVALLIPLHEPRPIDRLIDEGLVIPAQGAKTRLDHTRVKSKGTVSDLVAEQRQ
ncbi:type II toxin-antitoxin system Phd/YefM family antitoxin [Candidatus Poriferisocius sp.]|uniref:type II toxin-antitoxin system Phd/YefM family antitoxin n=1 Tax=Candidatus Poriferisocius sp. TaxID=3101276 RepID=UPI003B520818